MIQFNSREDIIALTPQWKGERFDDFANDQDWSLYFAVKYLCDFTR